MSDDFIKLSAAAGLPRIVFHELRHTHAALWLAAGGDIYVLSRRMGHTDPAFTFRQYGHLVAGRQREAAEKVAGMLYGQ